jgi:hypothetical protein
MAEENDWQTVREGLEVKLCRGPEGTETFVLCRSADRQVKERAMHQRFCAHIEEGLTRLGHRLERSRRSLDRGMVERQIGRLLERNTRAAGRYRVSVEPDDTCDSGLRLRWSVQPEWDDWARYSEGAYVLRTNISTGRRSRSGPPTSS